MRKKFAGNPIRDYEKTELINECVVEMEYGVFIDDEYPMAKYFAQLDTLIYKREREEKEMKNPKGRRTFR